MTLGLGEEYPKGGSAVPSRRCRRKILHFFLKGLKGLGLSCNGPLEGPKVQMFPKESQGLIDSLQVIRKDYWAACLWAAL